MAVMVLFLAFGLLYVWLTSLTKIGKTPEVQAINQEAQIEIIVADQMKKLEAEALENIKVEEKTEVFEFVEPEKKPDNGQIDPDNVIIEDDLNKVEKLDLIIPEEEEVKIPDPVKYSFRGQDINYGQQITVNAFITTYDPMLGGLNCWKWENNYCWSATKSGLGWEGLYGIGVACPPSLPHGTVVILPDNTNWICTDWGDMVIIDNDGNYHFDLQSYQYSVYDDKVTHEVRLIIPNSN